MKRNALSKDERIKSKKIIGKIFESGNIIFSGSKKLKTIYLIDTNPAKPGVQITVAVSKKAGNAVWRNRIKRLLKEAYRINKQKLTKNCIEKKIKLMLIFSPNNLNQAKNKKLNLKDVLPEMIDVLDKLCRI
ncbi:MAG: hypothetical protein Kow0098_05020 [Ignavibacteriaceae bacterium]